MKFSSSLFLLAVVVALASNVYTSPPCGELGGECQPSVQGKGCKNGLVCKTKPGTPPGGKGICHRPDLDIGGVCGGGIFYAAKCKAGLTCYVAPHDPHMTGVPGECRPLAKINEVCGGTVRYPAVCDDNLKCTYPPPPRPTGYGPAPVITGQTGKCKPIYMA